jgi:thiol-disulfide isomerase/thioredoxin
MKQWLRFRVIIGIVREARCSVNRRFVTVVAAGVLLGLGIGCNNEKPTGPTGRARVPGEVKVTAVKIDGLEKAVADAKGKVILIDFWATWCPPCVRSFPHLVEQHEKYADRGLVVISVSLDKSEKTQEVLGFLRKHGADFTNLHLDADATAGEVMENKFGYEGGIPHGAMFDRQGKRVWSGNPLIEGDNLDARIEAELAK